MSNWPSWYPPGCPPETAVPSAGVFYRLVRHNPPTEIDFETTLERQIKREENRAWTEEDVGLASVSVLNDRGDAENMRRLLPVMRKRKIALGHLENAGVMEHTPDNVTPSHHDWWRLDADTAWQTFSVVTP